MAKKLTALVDTSLPRVDVVDAGANLAKRFPIWKGKTMTHKEMIAKFLETPAPEEAKLEEFKKGLSEAGRAAFEAAFRTLAGFRDEVTPDVLKKMAEGLNLEAPVAPPKVPEVVPPVVPVVPVTPDKKDEDTMTETEIKKALEERDTVNKALSDKLETVTKALESERDIRVTNEWIAKCEKNLSHYPGKSMPEMAQVLKALAAVDPKLADAQFDTMKAASDAIKKGALLEEQGRAGGGNVGGAMDKIDKAAVELRKVDPKLTQAQAVAKAMNDNKDLYAEYLAEQKAR
ncbi:MAG: hypothetical protein PHE55_08825 [Methylococcaceae bacterium]|nr:hypothetical protein [Methylococcaceae bacterium]